MKTFNTFIGEAKASSRNFVTPKKTIKAYKLFRTLKKQPNKIFPLFIGKSKATPIGKWIPAEFIPTKGFASRPGWHVGRSPTAPHLLKRDGTMPPDRIWAEVEIPADVDWQTVANKSKSKDIRDIVPEGGHYRFKRPTNQGGEWLIAGSIKVTKILSNEEAKKIAESVLEESVVDGINKEPVTKTALRALEKYLDKLFANVGIDIDLMKRHFFERINDPRNRNQISIGELGKLFRQTYEKHGKTRKIGKMGPDAEGVLKDMVTDVNVPFVLVWDRRNSELDLVAKTIMRKKGFKTRNREFKV